MPRSSIRVMIVDDHPVVRAGLRALSDVDPEIQIVGEAANAGEALLLLRAQLPDLILLDVRLPGEGGISLCEKIKRTEPAPKVLFLTSFADDALVLAAMQAGAEGYLLKDSGHPQIAAAIRAVLRGEILFDPVSVRNGMQQRAESKAPALRRLSPQERKVLQEVSLGKTDKEVAAALGLTPKTARNYLDRVFEKLGVSTRTEAARAWIERSDEDRR